MEKNNFKNKVLIFLKKKKHLIGKRLKRFQKNFWNEIYNSWLQKVSLVKEFNDYLVLGVPTRF